MEIEEYFFEYIDVIHEKEFESAAEVIEFVKNYLSAEHKEILDGYKKAALCLNALKMGEFDDVEELWEEYEKLKEKLFPSLKYYSIFLEMSLTVEDMKDSIEKFI